MNLGISCAGVMVLMYNRCEEQYKIEVASGVRAGKSILLFEQFGTALIEPGCAFW